jgi:hypothetical protein
LVGPLYHLTCLLYRLFHCLPYPLGSLVAQIYRQTRHPNSILLLLLILSAGLPVQPAWAMLVIDITCSRAPGEPNQCDPLPAGPDGGLTNGGPGKAPIGSQVKSLELCNGGACSQLPVGSGDNAYPPKPSSWPGPNTPPASATGSVGMQSTCGVATTVEQWGQWYTNLQVGTCASQSTLSFIGATGGFGSPVFVTFKNNNNGNTVTLNAGTPLTVTTCPSGYSASGGSCVLSSDPDAKWPSDGKCTPKRTGNTFSDNPRDPDCTGGAASIPAPFTRSADGTSVSGTGPTGEKYSVSLAGDGTAKVKGIVPNVDGATSTVGTTDLSAPGSGNGVTLVTGNSQGTVKGTGSSAGDGTGSTDGLATEATAQGIKGELGQIKDELQKDTGGTAAFQRTPASTPAPDDLQQKIDEQKQALKDKFGQIKGEAYSLLAFSGSGSFVCSSGWQFEILGTLVDLCPAGFLGNIGFIGSVVLFIASVVSLVVILR